ncbi:MAG: hypothetical protein K9G64_07185 [Bacteroidia bacterium]|nr:hypothetical protein [Bacteroidia bacterium]
MNLNIIFSRIVFLLAIILILTIETKAQEPKEEKTKHAVGAGAGFTTGYGLSYRYTPNKLGVQVNFAPYKNGADYQYSFGLTALYSLMQTEKTTLYLYQANHYLASSFMEYDDSTPSVLKRKNESYFNHGIGFGVEFIIASKIGFNLMTGYATYDNFNKLNVTGEAALYFKF